MDFLDELGRRGSKNPSDGVDLLARMSGKSREEIMWTWQRLQQLRLVEHRSALSARLIIAKEARGKPWIKRR